MKDHPRITGLNYLKDQPKNQADVISIADAGHLVFIRKRRSDKQLRFSLNGHRETDWKTFKEAVSRIKEKISKAI